VRPLRDAAERARAAARAAAALEDGDADEWLMTALVSSTDSDAGSGSTETPIAIRSLSPGSCGGVLQPRGHHFALRMPGAGFSHHILAWFSGLVAEGSWQRRVFATATGSASVKKFKAHLARNTAQVLVAAAASAAGSASEAVGRQLSRRLATQHWKGLTGRLCQ
jgi:hypothetical protein